MEALQTIGMMLGAAWASGINLYATVLVLGISQQAGWVTLPAAMAPVSSWPVIIVAGVLYAIEFLADKIPAVDSFWDAAHTFIRPLGGAALAWMAVGDATPEFQLIATMIGGALALEAHAVKATTRLAINTSPEPFSNSAASVTEDVAVVGLVALALAHPVIAGAVVIVLLIGTLWLLFKLAKFLKLAARKIWGVFRKAPEGPSGDSPAQ